MIEIWKDIPEYEGFYQISNFGNVKAVARRLKDGRFRKERILKPYKDKDGYLKVTFFAGLSHSKHYMVHRLVAMAFIPNPDNLPIINHKDEVPYNNHVCNLEWCDISYNINYGNRNLKVAMLISGENHYHHKLTSEDVKRIRHIYIKGDKTFGQCALAREYGVSQSVIRRIVLRQGWKYV